MIEANKIVVATDPSTAISWLNLEKKKMNTVTTWYFKADQGVSSLIDAKPILFVDGKQSGPLTNAGKSTLLNTIFKKKSQLFPIKFKQQILQ